MSDLKLFRNTPSSVAAPPGGTIVLEKSLPTLFEANLEALLGVRFLASEFVTNQGGRMDNACVCNGQIIIVDLDLDDMMAVRRK